MTGEKLKSSEELGEKKEKDPKEIIEELKGMGFIEIGKGYKNTEGNFVDVSLNTGKDRVYNTNNGHIVAIIENKVFSAQSGSLEDSEKSGAFKKLNLKEDASLFVPFSNDRPDQKSTVGEEYLKNWENIKQKRAVTEQAKKDAESMKSSTAVEDQKKLEEVRGKLENL